MPKFILITLFLTFALAWVTQSIPAINYLEHATEPAKEFFYFPSKVNRKLNECNYCGGFYPQCCANLCGVLGYKYYQCLEYSCGCGN